ncbi:MAG: cyclopropane-fatty-acyl-phospholipid synthase [Parachlamydia sp.]|nr:MAG: cyclopropane-fatty-acyl-phospholipid synthase [Parachlamydia sp.]
MFFPTMLSKQASKELIHQIIAKADIEIGGNRPWDLQVHDESFYARVVRDGSLGLGETYTEGMWDCAAIDECFMRLLRENLDSHADSSWTMLWAALKAKVFNLQTKTNGLKVIHKHYQIGNDLYQNMLDSTLTYSCGYWKEAHNLEKAQQDKYDLICKKLYLRPGMTVLDIGCGWGGFAKFAAEKYGVHVTGITLSENQAEYAKKVCRGLPIEIKILDYRDIDETYDRIIEIGMFEHVGVKNYREFMEVVHRALAPEGLFLLHTIGANYTALASDPWIDAYIFPNGHIPSIVEVGEAIEKLFVVEDWHNFGADYDKTLMAWDQNFNQNWPKISAKYGESFYRMWRYYLLSCAGSFRARSLQLWQVVLSKNGLVGGYLSVR